MENFFSSLIDFVTSSHRTVTNKGAYVIMFIVIFICVDLATDFFLNVFIGQKIDQIEKIEGILSHEGIDPEVKRHMQKLEKEIIGRKNYREFSSDFISGLESNIVARTQKIAGTNSTATPKILEPWIVYHTISSGWIIVLLMVIFPIFSLFTTKIDILTIASTIIIEFVAFILLLCNAYLFSLIPIVGDGLINIFVNVVGHFCLFCSIGIRLNSWHRQRKPMNAKVK